MPSPQAANGEDSQSLDYGDNELTYSKESQRADKKGWWSAWLYGVVGGGILLYNK